MAYKASIPKGTRDFSPEEMARRNYVFDTIRQVYHLHGFMQIETPAMETLQTLMGKYGEEGDKLLFKVLNSGDFLSKVDEDTYAQRNSVRLTNKICERGLRYDLTVPFARYVVMHREELQLPFKRFQIQPVWRADRPQKGRYREFYQCDADVVGSGSLLNELELLQMIDEVFSRLQIPVQIKINNRKLLAGMAEVLGEKDKLTAMTVAMDKLDKIGPDAVVEELAKAGFPEEAIERLLPIINIEGDNRSKMKEMSAWMASSAIGTKGVEEMTCLLDLAERIELTNEIQLDLSLARGLNYYTGAIFEVKAMNVEMGSIAGGGRYDDLTGIFGMPGLSGVGISFGADRICDVLQMLNLYPSEIAHTTDVLFVNFGEKELAYLLPVSVELRRQGISTEIYPDAVKMKKQMAYANANHVPFVVIAGEEEMNAHQLTVKNMTTGEQVKIEKDKILLTITNRQ